MIYFTCGMSSITYLRFYIYGTAKLLRHPSVRSIDCANSIPFWRWSISLGMSNIHLNLCWFASVWGHRRHVHELAASPFDMIHQNRKDLSQALVDSFEIQQVLQTVNIHVLTVICTWKEIDLMEPDLADWIHGNLTNPSSILPFRLHEDLVRL